MTKIIDQRMTAALDSELVVFLIGMRVNKFLSVHKWWPVANAMTGMIQELEQQPESGFIHAEAWFGRTSIMVQYWRSFEQLEAYARSRDHRHLPAWAAFNRRVAANGAVGIWHETYRVRPGEFESIYHQMPAFGMGRAIGLVPASGQRESAQQRMNAAAAGK